MVVCENIFFKLYFQVARYNQYIRLMNNDVQLPNKERS